MGDFDGNGSTETIYALPSSLTTVDIAGLGTVNVIDATGIYGFPGFRFAVEPGEELLLLPAVIIGTLDSPPSLDSFTGVAGIGSPALSGYDFTTSFGPIVGDGGVGHPPSPIKHHWRRSPPWPRTTSRVRRPDSRRPCRSRRACCCSCPAFCRSRGAVASESARFDVNPPEGRTIISFKG